MEEYERALTNVQHRYRTSLKAVSMHARNSAEHAGNVPNKVNAPVDRLIVRKQATADSLTSDGLWCKIKQRTHNMSKI